MENLEQLLDKYVKLTLDIMCKTTERDEVHAEIAQARSRNGHKEGTEKPWGNYDKYSPAPPKQQDDILALLHPEHGRTVQNLATLTNRSYMHCYGRLHKLEAAGKARVERDADCRVAHHWYAVV